MTGLLNCAYCGRVYDPARGHRCPDPPACVAVARAVALPDPHPRSEGMPVPTKRTVYQKRPAPDPATFGVPVSGRAGPPPDVCPDNLSGLIGEFINLTELLLRCPPDSPENLVGQVLATLCGCYCRGRSTGDPAPPLRDLVDHLAPFAARQRAAGGFAVHANPEAGR